MGRAREGKRVWRMRKEGADKKASAETGKGQSARMPGAHRVA